MAETGYYAVIIGRKPGIYKKRVDAILQTKNFPNGYFIQCETMELACSYLKNSSDELSFYAVKIGRTPGFYTNYKDAIKQTMRFSGSLVKKFKTFEEAQSFLKEPVKNNRKPCISTERECIEEKAKRFPGTHAKSVDSAGETVQPILNKSFVYSDNNIAGTGESSGSEFTVCNQNSRLSNECSEAFEYVSKPPKHEMDDLSTFYLVLKRLKVDESGRYMPVVRFPDESVVVFAWGGRLGKGVNSNVAIGVYWGPNHPLNVSRKITGEQTVARAEEHAVLFALYQTKQIKAVAVTLYCNWRLISEVTQKVKCFKNKALKDKVSDITQHLMKQGIDVKYQYIPEHEVEKGHIGKNGIFEAKQLAAAANNFSLSTENVISEFENAHNKENNSLMEFVTRVTKISNNEDDVLAAELNKSAPIELLTSNTEASSDKNYIKQFILMLEDLKRARFDISITTEENDTAHKLSNNTRMELETFTDVFICGRSFISDSRRAGIGIYWSQNNKLNTSLRLLGEQIKNRADIWAATHAFLQAKQLCLINIRVYTDSQFVVKEIMTYLQKCKSKNWDIEEGFPIIYKEDVKLLNEAMTGLNVKWCYVMERNSSLGLVEAERLAVAGGFKLAVE